MEKAGYVYILGNDHGMFYVGVTSNLQQRMWQHKTHALDGYTTRYQCHRLLYWEEFSRIEDAIVAEKTIKGWSRTKKSNLIRRNNSMFSDLARGWFDEEDVLTERRRNEHALNPSP